MGADGRYRSGNCKWSLLTIAEMHVGGATRAWKGKLGSCLRGFWGTLVRRVEDFVAECDFQCEVDSCRGLDKVALFALTVYWSEGGS